MSKKIKYTDEPIKMGARVKTRTSPLKACCKE